MTEVALSQTHIVSCEGTRGLLGSSRALGRASNPPNFRATGNTHKDNYSLYIFINYLLQNCMLNERKSEQAHIPHAPTLPENAVYNEWQFQALGTGNRTKKGI